VFTELTDILDTRSVLVDILDTRSVLLVFQCLLSWLIF